MKATYKVGQSQTVLSAAMALAYRLPLGGAGVIMGVLVIVSASAWGWYFYRRWTRAGRAVGLRQLLLLGVVVHLTELSLMATLPAPLGWQTLQSLRLPIMRAFPLLTLLLGKMLLSQDAVAQAVAALRKSEHQHRSILQAAMDGFWLSDLQGRLLEVNQAYARMNGHSVAELLAMRVSQLEANESAAVSLAQIQKVVNSGSDRFESRHRAKDGRVFDVQVSAQFHAVEAGHVVAFLRDITERKRSEQALLDAKALTEAIVENAPLMIFLKDASSLRYVLLNRAGEALLGYGRDALIGRSDPDFFRQRKPTTSCARTGRFWRVTWARRTRRSNQSARPTRGYGFCTRARSVFAGVMAARNTCWGFQRT